jgi:hypothetical protein
MEECGVRSYDSRKTPVAGSWEHENGHSGFIKAGHFRFSTRLTCRSLNSSLCLAVEADPGRAVPETKARRVKPVSRRRQRLDHGAAGQRSGAVRPVHLLHCKSSVSRTQYSSRNEPTDRSILHNMHKSTLLCSASHAYPQSQ